MFIVNIIQMYLDKQLYIEQNLHKCYDKIA